MQALAQDLWLGARALRRRPRLAAAVVLILGFGIGATVTVFGTVDAFLFRPLPYPQAEGLVWIRSSHVGNLMGVSHPDYLDWKESAAFADLAKLNADEYLVLNPGGEAESVLATRTTSNLFSVLGVQPFLGRTFSTQEDRPGNGSAVLLSHDLWRRRFGADRGVLGKGVKVDGASYTVVGVMPPGFHFPARSDIWLPSSAWADQWPHRDIRTDTVIGRLRRGVTAEEARAALATVGARLESEHPETNSGIRPHLVPLREVWTGASRGGLLLLLAACGFLLLIACTNAAGLLLVWAGSREREIAIRMAFGIQPSRQLRQPLLEAVLLGLTSGAAGLLLAAWGLRLVAWLLPRDLPTWIDLRLDARAFIAALLVSLLAGLLAAAAPALRSLAVQPHRLLQQDARTVGGGRDTRTPRRGFVVAEIAVSLLLLTGTGLMLASFARLLSVKPGFETDHVLTLQIDLPVLSLESYEQVLDQYRRILARVGALPGVTAAGMTTRLPLTARNSWPLWEFGIDGQTPEEQRRNPRARGHVVSAGYFQAMGISLLRGRSFEARDAMPMTPGAVVSRHFAERFWPGEDAVGKRLRLGGGTGLAATVVGVVENVRCESLAEDSGLDLYFPVELLPSWPIHLVVKGEQEPRQLAAALRREIRSVSADLGVRDIATLEEQVARSLWQPRIWATLLSVFSVLAILLVATGIYSVVSHLVRQRTPEIGLRVAIGAGRGEILRTLLGESARLSAAGIVLGSAGALAAGRFLASSLYELRNGDFAILSVAAVLLLTVTLAAASIPIRRALRVDPAIALRSD